MKKVSNKGKNNTVLALGAESAGNFAVFYKGRIFYSDNFGDLLDLKNFEHFQRAVLELLEKEKIKPDNIITDFHPLYRTTVWGRELAKKFKAEHIQVQHHKAHIFSQSINLEKADKSPWLRVASYGLHDAYGIALDGTGYGTDGKIWGGEIFKVNLNSPPLEKGELEGDLKDLPILPIERIGHLENQTLIGGDLAIKEPARLLISILAKIPIKSDFTILRNMVKLGKNHPNKNLAYYFVKKYYNKNEFELLWNQLQQNFNCQDSSSTGRVLDAVSVLLGFAKNERNEKHEATYLLEKNSTKPYLNLEPKIKNLPLEKGDVRRTEGFEKCILETTPLFKYLIKNLHKDKKRLAATAQLYIAKGLHEIIKRHETSDKEQGAIKKYRTTNRELRVASCELRIILSGGLSENKIIKEYFESKNLLQNKKFTPLRANLMGSHIVRGDAGLSVGQINYYLLK